MEYFLNEYSLRGQFRNTDDFFESLRLQTIPVIDKIQKEAGSVIIKKDTFWQLEVCNGIRLNEIPNRKNERSGEMFAFKRRLINIVKSEPFWHIEEQDGIGAVEYKFDEEYRDNFEPQNCFVKAFAAEGRIVSFKHAEYGSDKLTIAIKKEDKLFDYELDNITDTAWWIKAPKIATWHVDEKYLVEVRAKEFDYHPPHFHVSCNDGSAVYTLSTGKLYKGGKKLPADMDKHIKKWYIANRDELNKAWDSLHGKDAVKKK